MIVADTCLVVHLFNSTALTKIARKVLRKDPEWILPGLWKDEYANVLSKLARKEQRDTDLIINHFNDTAREFKNSEIHVDVQTALRVSIEYKISVYDAHFVILALEYETLLVTEDQEVLKKCPLFSISMKNFAKD